MSAAFSLSDYLTGLKAPTNNNKLSDYCITQSVKGGAFAVVSMFLPSPLFHVTSQTLMAMQVPRLRNFLAGRRRRRGKLSIIDEARLRFPFVVVKGTSVLKTGFVQQGEEIKIIT